jgi:hypothetical protein
MKAGDKNFKKVSVFKLGIFVILALLFTGCATGNLISFSENTFFDRSEYTNIRELGPVLGESSQTMVLYLFPRYLPASTTDAMQDALSQYDNTVFLANVAIENRNKVYVGYSRTCTLVTATAYTADKIEK